MALGLVFNAGSRVTGAQLQSLVTQIDSLTAPGWTAYTPVWTASPTNPVLGNGTLTGRYRRPANADVIVVEIRLLMGSSTTYGSGFWTFSVPTNASVTAATTAVGDAYFGDTGVIDRSGIVRFSSASQLCLDHPTLGVVTSTVPHTWGSTDLLQLQIAYEPA